MRLVSSKEIRAAAAQALRTARRTLPEEVRSSASLASMNHVESLIRERRADAKRDVRGAFPEELSAVYVASMTSGLLGAALVSDSKGMSEHPVALPPA